LRSQGDKDASVKVTYNGNSAATVTNNPKSGYPCNGNKCISKTGTYIVMDQIEGGTVEYLFEFTANKADRPSPEIGSRMWLGAGEAAFTGSNAASPPVPSGPNVKTAVTAINAMTGKKIGVGLKGSDGHKRFGCVSVCVCWCVVCVGVIVCVCVSLCVGVFSRACMRVCLNSYVRKHTRSHTHKDTQRHITLIHTS
jgi:hypothetical protein